MEHVAVIYGQECLTYNMHSLIHLAQDVKRFGSLDNVCSFPFENFLSQLKKLVRKPNQPLQQVVRRLGEMKLAVSKCMSSSNCNELSFHKQHADGPLVTGTGLSIRAQYKELNKSDLCMKVTVGNNCFQTYDGRIIVIHNILNTYSDAIYLIYKYFIEVGNYFTYPCNSRDIGIFMVSKLSKELYCCSIVEVWRKCVLLPYKTNYVAIPLLHG